MDYETIENEIYDFIAVHFKEVLSISDSNLDFIENNNLYMPKHDYTILMDFLNKTINNFKTLDDNFLSSTLKKLQIDLSQLASSHNQVQKQSSDILNIFKSEFINFSPILSGYTKIIVKTNNQSEKTPDEITHLNYLKQNFINLKKIYYELFEEIFFEEKRILLKMLKSSINTKSYYLDRLLWKNTNKSIQIVKHLQIRKMEEELNSKEYIKYICSLMRPYTDEYKYLQSCLKVYR